MKADPELHDGADPVAKHPHTLQAVIHLPVVEDDLVVTGLDSARRRHLRYNN